MMRQLEIALLDRSNIILKVGIIYTHDLSTRLTHGDGSALGRLLQYFYNPEFCGVWKLKFRRKVHSDSGYFSLRPSATSDTISAP